MSTRSSSSSSSWKRESGYIWSMIGSAVGFANIIAFSARTYLYGGSAFLIPFVVALFVLGVPMLLLEGSIGHAYHFPLVRAYDTVAGGIGRFFGWLAVIACGTIGSFYIVLTGYSVAYIWFTAADRIPVDAAAFFEHSFIKLSAHIFDFTTFSWMALLCTGLVILFTWYIMIRNIQAGVERVCSLFLPLLFGLMVLFVIVVYFLPGAHIGFFHYLWPDFSRLAEPALWRDTFGHLFFSISAGLGIIVGYSRHTKPSMNIRRAMFYVVFGDFFISFISGLAIFGCMGYMSMTQQMPFHSIITSSSIFEIGFKTFPTILQQLGTFLYPVVGSVFFFCLFIAGITGVFSIVESLVGNFEFEFSCSRKQAVFLALSIMSVVALLFCFGNGMYLLGALEPIVMGLNMLVGGMALIFFFMYRDPRIRQDPVWFVAKRRSLFYYAITYGAFPLLIVIFWWNAKDVMCRSCTYADLVGWCWLGFAALLSIVCTVVPILKKKGRL